MSPTQPIDIVLEIAGLGLADDTAPRKYLVRKRSGSFKPVEFVWSDELRRDLEAIREDTPDRVKLAAIGERLAPFLADEAERILAAPPDVPVRISLQLQSVSPEIAALPWELITLGESMRTLASLPNCVLRYEVAGAPTQRPDQSPHAEGGRILLAYSTLGGAVPHVPHANILAAACQAGHLPFDRTRDTLANRPLSALAETLAAAAAEGRPFTVLHLLCHGGRLAAGTQAFGLVWGDERGQPVNLDPGVLADTLGPFARHGLRLIIVSACLGGDAGAPGNPMRSVAERLHRAGIEAVIASRFRLSIPGSIVLAKEFYDRLLGAPSSVEEAFRATRNRLFDRFAATTLDHSAVQLWARRGDGWDTRPIVVAPYRGLLPFERQHERLFFGRKGQDSAGNPREVDALITKLFALAAAGTPRFMMVAGDSGTGKSSMVLAGAVPELEARGLRWASMRPGAAPADQLTAALASLADVAGARLLIVDQFEEVFTGGADLDERTAFVRRLWDLAHGPAAAGLSVIVTMRIDFLGRCGEILLDRACGLRLDKVVCDARHQVLVARMDAEQLRLAIEGPAHKVGIELAPGLTDRILDDVDHEPGALPLVQHTLSLLWQRRDGRTLTAAAYGVLGGVGGALNRHADGVIDGFDAPGGRIARRLLMRLIHIAPDDAAPSCRRVALHELRPEGSGADRHDAVIDELVRQRLLVRAGDHTVQTVEVAHEALIRRWARLAEWIREERGKLLELAELRGWEETHRKRGTLLTEGQLALAERLLQADDDLVGPEARALVRTSRAEVDRVKEQARRFRDTLRVTVAREYVAKDHGVSAALLREVEARDLFRVPSWFDCMADVLRRPGMTLTVLADHPTRITDAVWSPDGTRIVTVAARPVFGVAPALLRSTMALFPEHRETDRSAPADARVWDTVTGELLVRLTGHLDSVQAAAWSPDGTRIVTASADRSARVWDARTGAALVGLWGHQEAVQAAHWSPRGDRILTAGHDASARVWDAATGELLATLRIARPSFPSGGVALDGPTPSSPRGASPHYLGNQVANDEPVRAAAWDRHGARIAVTSIDEVRVHDAATAAVLVTLAGHRATVWTVDWDPRGDRLLTASLDHTACIWDATTGDLLRTLWDHRDNVCAAAWSPDGSRIVTASWDRSARVWDAATGQSLVALVGHTDKLVAAQWTGDGTRIVTASEDRTARVWDAATGELLTTLVGHDGALTTAAWHADGTRIATTSEDRTARVWLATTREAFTRFADHEGPITAGGWSPDAARIATASFETGLVWNAATGATIVALRGHTRLITAIVWSPEGDRLLTTSEDRTAQVWDADSGAPLVAMHGHTALLNGGAWSPDGARVVTTSDDRTLRVWDAATGVELAVLHGHVDDVTRAVWSPDGARIISACRTRIDRDVRVWDVATGASTATLGHTARVTGIAWSPDGAMIASAAARTQVWDAATGRLIVALDDPAAVTDVAWSPDGTQLAAVAADRSLRVWDVATGALLATMTGHDDTIHAFAWSPDGLQIVSASEDRTARVWNAATGEVVAVLRGHADQVLLAAWSLDGTKLLTASSDGTARVWLFGAARLRGHLWHVNPLCLTRRQRMRLLDEDEITAERNAKLAHLERSRRLRR